MSFGALLAKLQSHREQMKKRPCERCGLLYDPGRHEKCPHCGTLDEAGLKRLFQKKERAYQANRRLGLAFGVAAGVMMLVLGLFLALS